MVPVPCQAGCYNHQSAQPEYKCYGHRPDRDLFIHLDYFKFSNRLLFLRRDINYL